MWGAIFNSPKKEKSDEIFDWFCLLFMGSQGVCRGRHARLKTATRLFCCTLSRSRRLPRRITPPWRKRVQRAIPLKHAQLAAISASVAMKCVYCIPAHTAFARAAGATEEEIKTAVAIAADVALNSSMLYGNQFDMETFMKMFE
ncbi:MAG: hypothetical protein CM15mP74_30760 [Halieaceae bacterium]|nr:MAG: hypothetical protein CM15mP74_30760 [Halieaceae bacterium]